jgi:hypothetical protein
MGSESPRQKKTIARVMLEFKQGKLESGSSGSGAGGGGYRVRSPRQAIAIALSEAGASKNLTPPENRRRQERTQQAPAKPEDKGSGAPQTHAQLMKQARAAGIPGRTRMTKSQLERALRRL